MNQHPFQQQKLTQHQRQRALTRNARYLGLIVVAWWLAAAVTIIVGGSQHFDPDRTFLVVMMQLCVSGIFGIYYQEADLALLACNQQLRASE